MKKMTTFAKLWGGIALILSLAIPISCSDDKNTKDNQNDSELPDVPEKPDPSVEIKLSEIIGAWDAIGYQWDLNDDKTLFYLMDDGDYAVDENGDYIIMTVKEYCEQFAKDYNADPANEIVCTAEDVASVSYEGSIAFTNINVTDKKIELFYGNKGLISVCSVTGTYTYDQQTGIMTVNNVAIESEPTTLQIKISKDADGNMCFRYWDMGPFGHNSYDDTKKYTIWGTYNFVCVPGTPYE